jgi:hypothetical protein
MQDPYEGRIVPGMDVCDRNSEKVGTVAHVYRYEPAVMSMAGGSSRLPQQELVEVKTGFLGLGKRLYLPYGFIQEVTEGGVFLSKAADEVMHNDMLHYKPSYLDDLD